MTRNKAAAQGRLTVEQVNVGDILEWQNGLGGTERETVTLGKHTGRLAVRGASGTEHSVFSLLSIDNGCRIVGTEAE